MPTKIRTSYSETLIEMSSPLASDRPQAVYKAIAHPFRRQLIGYMIDLDRPMAAVEYVKDRGVNGKSYDAAISYVSYHLRQLEAAGTIEVAATEQKRGANKTLFRVAKEFASAYGDTLALNKIAALLGKVSGDGKDGLMKQIEGIVSSTGRSIAAEGATP
jgi:hypothetical protein